MKQNLTVGESRLASFFKQPTIRIADTIGHCQRHGFPVLTHPLLPNTTNETRFAVCRLENAIVFGKDFIILSDEDLLVGGLVNNPELFASFALRKLVARSFTVSQYDSSPAFLVGGAENLGHFLFNYFSRLSYLLLFEKLQNLPIITSGTAHQNHDELLQIAGYPEARQVKIWPNQAVLFKELYVPTMLAGKNPSSQLFECFNFVPIFIQKVALKAINGSLLSGRPRRVYLSRSTARWRRVLNEAEVIRCLKKFQFEVIDPGTLTIAEQVGLAQNSEIIIGPMGNNMNLHWFARPKTVVIQFLYDQRMNLTPALAEIFQQKYFEVYGTPLKEGKDDMNYDFSVPIEPLESLLQDITVR